MSDLNTIDLPTLFDRLVSDTMLDRLLTEALREDLGDVGDVTSRAMIDRDATARGVLVAREAGVVCGLPILARATHPLVQSVATGSTVAVEDGTLVDAGTTLLSCECTLRELLALERTLLNLVGHMSGVATMARRFVDAIDGTGAVICDTRKTTPGLRRLEKYASRAGGAHLHRLGLHDAMLIKDNHLAHLETGNLAAALDESIRRARDASSLWFVEVECDSLDQFEQVLSLDDGLVDYALLDNMSNDELREAVSLRHAKGRSIKIEASGGVTLDTVRSIAETGVDRISVGAITHSPPRLDVALDIV
ncbi:MAG: carboxylating nicotinate-nucleotide diphosphorylase [Planctomycetota bacterium]